MTRFGKVKSQVLWGVLVAIVLVITAIWLWTPSSETIDGASDTSRQATEEIRRNPVMPPSATRAIEPVPTH